MSQQGAKVTAYSQSTCTLCVSSVSKICIASLKFGVSLNEELHPYITLKFSILNANSRIFHSSPEFGNKFFNYLLPADVLMWRFDLNL